MFTKLLLEYPWWDQNNLFSQLKIGDFLSQFSKHSGMKGFFAFWPHVNWPKSKNWTK